MMYGSGEATGKMSDAMLNAVRAQVFSRPLASLMHPGTVSQGQRTGPRGAHGGHTQGYVGANVPQTGQNTPKAGTAAGQRPSTPAAGPAAQTGNNAPSGGLSSLSPLLGFLVPFILHGLNGMMGAGAGGFGSTPQGQGKI